MHWTGSVKTPFCLRATAKIVLKKMQQGPAKKVPDIFFCRNNENLLIIILSLSSIDFCCWSILYRSTNTPVINFK